MQAMLIVSHRMTTDAAWQVQVLVFGSKDEAKRAAEKLRTSFTAKMVPDFHVEVV